MDQKHLKLICEKYKLGSPEVTVTKIDGSRGGSFIWRINTKKGSYAIKQLSPAIHLTDARVVAKYELSETIAYHFSQQGISAVFAIEESGNRLTITENKGYLVYPWIEGYILKQNEIPESHALKIAEMTAKIHNINMTVPEIGSIRFDIHSNDSIVNAIDKAISCKCSCAKALKEKQNILLSMNDNYLQFIPILKEHSVVTHGDIDPLNIIWDKLDQPTLIDWESAKKMNPTHEIVRTSLRFSGVGTKNFSLPTYANMLHTYDQNGGVLNKNHIAAALNVVDGSTINWILYNIESACTTNFLEERNKACNEIERVLSSLNIEQSQAMISRLLNIK